MKKNWMVPERIWILDTKEKHRICGVYLRPNNTTNLVEFTRNQELLFVITEEVLNRRLNGYKPLILGDTNAHVKILDHFQFENYLPTC